MPKRGHTAGVSTAALLAMVTLVGFLCVGLSVVIGAGNQIFRLELGGEAVLAANLGIGLIALVFGAHLVMTWPIIGQYNDAFGEMSVLLGVTFLGAAVCLARASWAVASA